MNLFGAEFAINGTVLDGLIPDEAFVISQRNVILTGVLADGSPFRFNLASQRFAATATLTITLDESTPTGDYNSDGIVNAADYLIWRKNDSTPEGYRIWRANFGRTIGSGQGVGANAAVPERASVMFVVLSAAISLFKRTRCLNDRHAR